MDFHHHNLKFQVLKSGPLKCQKEDENSVMDRICSFLFHTDMLVKKGPDILKAC